MEKTDRSAEQAGKVLKGATVTRLEDLKEKLPTLARWGHAACVAEIRMLEAEAAGNGKLAGAWKVSVDEFAEKAKVNAPWGMFKFA